MPGRQNNKHPARPYHKRIQQPKGKITPVELASVYLCDFPIVDRDIPLEMAGRQFRRSLFCLFESMWSESWCKSTLFYFLFKQQKETIFIIFISNGKTKVYINMKNWGFQKIFLTSVVFMGVSEPPTAWNYYYRHSTSPLSTLGCAKGGGVRFSEEPPSAGAASHVHFDEKLHDSVVMVTPEGDGNFMVKVCSWSCCCAFWKQADIVTLIWRKLRNVRTAIFFSVTAERNVSLVKTRWFVRCDWP